MASKPIRNVVFDFGGVLVNWKPQAVVAEMFEDAETRETIMRSVFRHPDWLELDRGSFSETEAVRRFARRSGVSRVLINQLMDRIRGSLTLMPEMAALVRSLTASGVPVYGLSNMSEATFALLERRYDIWSVFTGIVISGKIGLVKPERGIFEHIVAAYALDAAETVFVDDLEANVVAAAREGFQTILFRESIACASELRTRLNRG